MSWFEDDGEGRYLSGPGVSPETGFYAPDGTGPNVLSYVSNGASHDQLLGRESLRNYIYACGELGVQTPTLLKAVQFLRKIPQPAIGPDGRVQEWKQPFEEMQKGHRHISHLYGLFPGTEWDILNTPEYAEAVRKSADFRRKYADMGNNGIRTGWSTAWLINLYAALGDGNAAEDRMYTMLRHYINSNLFDIHPPVPDRRKFRLFLRRGRMPDPKPDHAGRVPGYPAGSGSGRRLEEGFRHGIAYAGRA